MKKHEQLYSLFIVLPLLSLLPILIQGDPYWMQALIVALIWGGVASIWNFTMAYAGVWSFGQIAFFVVGAYASGMLTKSLGISPWLGMLMGGITASAVGAIIGLPSLRLRGVYVALITFALHLLLGPLIKLGAPIGTGGARGLLGIPPLQIGGYVFTSMERIPTYYLTLVVASLILFFIYKIINSSFGLSFVALRDAEDLAKSLGVDDYKCTLMVFSLSAFLTGVLGAYYAHYVQFISHRMLGLDTFLMCLLMVIIGGYGRFPGAFIGGLIIILLNEFLRAFDEYRILILGVIMVLTIIVMPRGLMGVVLDSFVPIARRRFIRGTP